MCRVGCALEDVENVYSLEGRQSSDDGQANREEEQSVLIPDVLALDDLCSEKQQRAPERDCAVDPPWLVHVSSLSKE